MKSIKILLITLVLLHTKLYAQVPQIDDKAISIQSIDIDSKIIGNTAVTKIKYVFYNSSNRNLEAKLTFPLPEGTTISQYAIDIKGKLRYAVPVPKERAKEVFESIQHRNVDPGIVEQVSGNNFRARISPVPPAGSRTMEITFLNELKENNNGNLEYYLTFNDQQFAAFNLNVNYLGNKVSPNVIENIDGSFAFQHNKDQWFATLNKSNFKPNTSLRLEIPSSKEEYNKSVFQSASDNQYYFVNSIHIPSKQINIDLPKKVAVVWDNSLSGLDRNFKKEWELLNAYLAKLPANSSIALYFLNNEFSASKIFTNSNNSLNDLRKSLESTYYDGGTDFSKLKEIQDVQTVLLFSDGISSFGDINTNINNKYYCITSTPKSDYSTLRYLSQKNGGQLINLNESSTEKGIDILTKNSLQFLGVKNAFNVRETYPSKGIITNNTLNIAGILTTTQGSFVALFGYDGKVTQEIKVNVEAAPDFVISGFNVAQIWAQKKISELNINHFQNSKEIRTLSNQFSVVSRNTSLIVLEEVEDYVKYNITPPKELLASYNEIINERKREYAASKKSILNKIAQKTQELKAWHATDFAAANIKQNDYPQVKLQSMSNADQASAEMSGEYEEGDGDYGYEGEFNNDKKGKIVLADISSNAVYMKDFNKLQNANEIYDLYLKKRDSYKYLSKYYFDIANLLFSKDKNLAMRVLSSLADLDLENEELFKTIYYVLKQRGENAKQLWATKKVLEWRPFDAQSHRDYALALLDNNKPQDALNVYRDLIYQDFTEELSTRDNGIEEILVMEINNIISRFPQVNKDKVNKAFIAELPVDIRVVLNWNKDHTDIDLWITDPNEEECYYSHRATKIGGRLSNDFTQGFGPEQFLLKKAIKGTYQIKTNFYAERQFSLDEPTAIMAEVYLYYSSGKQERKVIVFQNDSSAANPSDSNANKTLIGKFIF